jgi:hypothetical protein
MKFGMELFLQQVVEEYDLRENRHFDGRTLPKHIKYIYFLLSTFMDRFG